MPDACYRLADEKYKAKEYDTALVWYTKAMRAYPGFQESPWGLFQTGNIYRNQKRYAEAIDAYNDLIKRYPGSYWAGQAQWKIDDTGWEHEYLAKSR